MTVEADIHTVLITVCARVYPDIAPLSVARPYIVYQQAGGDAPTFLERAVPSKKNGRFAINCWSDTRGEAASMAILVESAMVTATTFQSDPLSAPIALYDEDTKYRGTSQDFTVWSDR